MKWSTLLLLPAFFALAPATGVQAQQQPTIAKTNLKIGQPAPDFTLLDNHWEKVRLSDFRGKKTVILAFYVLAFTSS